MTAVTLARRPFAGSQPGRIGTSRRAHLRAWEYLVYLVLAGVCLAAVAKLGSHSLVLVGAIAAFAVLGLWMFVSIRHERTLAVLLLYLGLADGYVKLKSGHSYATLGRDVLLYAICLGIVARGIVARRPVPRAVPLMSWIIALVAIALAEVANPAGESFTHSLASLRPDLEFVPLFFLGYTFLRSARALRTLMVLLLLVALANGVVGWVQSGLTPAQLASWGPGYAADVNGTGALSSRTFVNAAGQSQVRPFGLGSDEGQGGAFGLLALPAGLAILALGSRRKYRVLVALGAIGLAGGVLGVITSQGRGVVIGAVLTVAAYFALSVSARNLVPSLAAIAVAVLIGALVITSAASGSGQNSLFSRFSTVTPGKLLGTTSQERGSTLTLGATYAYTIPLGAGLGKVGPASTVVSAAVSTYNGEDEFNFLIVELGDAGLVVVIGLTIRMLFLTTRVRRVTQPELRLLLAALAAPLVGIVAQYVNGPVTTASPYAPYLWLAAGALSYWFLSPGAPALAGQDSTRSALVPAGGSGVIARAQVEM